MFLQIIKVAAIIAALFIQSFDANEDVEVSLNMAKKNWTVQNCIVASMNVSIAVNLDDSHTETIQINPSSEAMVTGNCSMNNNDQNMKLSWTTVDKANTSIILNRTLTFIFVQNSTAKVYGIGSIMGQIDILEKDENNRTVSKTLYMMKEFQDLAIRNNIGNSYSCNSGIDINLNSWYNQTSDDKTTTPNTTPTTTKHTTTIHTTKHTTPTTTKHTTPTTTKHTTPATTKHTTPTTTKHTTPTTTKHTTSTTAQHTTPTTTKPTTPTTPLHTTSTTTKQTTPTTTKHTTPTTTQHTTPTATKPKTPTTTQITTPKVTNATNKSTTPSTTESTTYNSTTSASTITTSNEKIKTFQNGTTTVKTTQTTMGKTSPTTSAKTSSKTTTSTPTKTTVSPNKPLKTIISLRNMNVDAFRNSSISPNIFQNSISCSGDEHHPESDIIPIVVGAVLAGLILVTLAAYLIGRKFKKEESYSDVE